MGLTSAEAIILKYKWSIRAVRKLHVMAYNLDTNTIKYKNTFYILIKRLLQPTCVHYKHYKPRSIIFKTADVNTS